VRARNVLAGLAWAGLAILCGPGRAVAQTLEVTPIQVELTSATPNNLVTLHNLGSEAVRYQVSVFAWQQSPRGEMRLSKTKDVLFFPSLLTIGPGERRNLRVAAAAPFEPVEKTYRMFVEQLPGAPDPSRTAVRVLTRVGIPVYLEPGTLAATAELDPPVVAGRRISFVLRNTGNVRIRPDLVRVIGRGEKDEIVFEQAVPAWYVLAGGERAFDAEAPAEGCGRVRTVSVAVTLASGNLAKQIAASGGACGP
jgi:fimbrial chaperone protein